MLNRDLENKNTKRKKILQKEARDFNDSYLYLCLAVSTILVL